MEGSNNDITMLPSSSGNQVNVVQAADVEDKQKEKKNRPSESKFKQQKLPAWQPILTAGTVLPTFFAIGIIFIPLGAVFLVSSNKVYEEILDYTDCVGTLSTAGQPPQPNFPCKNLTVPSSGQSCKCVKQIKITESTVGQQLFVYYGLTNFYQNHRRYVKSRDDAQLQGTPTLASQDCLPFRYVNDSPSASERIPFAPCGAIANSMFNDSFQVFNSTKKLGWQRMGIAWYTDKSVKFKNPAGAKDCGQDLACWKQVFAGTEKPPFWQKPVYELDLEHPDNNGFENEDLIVWMRTAALPNFRKLYAIFENGLEAGDYELHILYNYPTAPFAGRKRLILSTTSWLGGKNPFLGVAYIVVGCLCIVLGIVFTVIHVKFGKTIAELSNINAGSSFN